jgi:hypothetical protein
METKIQKYACANCCEPEDDTYPFVYHDDEVTDEAGILADDELMPSNTYGDGTRGVPSDQREYFQDSDEVPVCRICGAEAVPVEVRDLIRSIRDGAKPPATDKRTDEGDKYKFVLSSLGSAFWTKNERKWADAYRKLSGIVGQKRGK